VFLCNSKVYSVFAKARHWKPGGKGVEAKEGVAGATAPGGKMSILHGKKKIMFKLNKYVLSQTKQIQ
jgi:hypothetical protein